MSNPLDPNQPLSPYEVAVWRDYLDTVDVTIDEKSPMSAIELSRLIVTIEKQQAELIAMRALVERIEQSIDHNIERVGQAG